MHLYDRLTIRTLYLHSFSCIDILSENVAARWVRAMDDIRHYLNRVGRAVRAIARMEKIL